MSGVIGRIANEGSGARLNGRQYREWYAKVKRHDKLEAALSALFEACMAADADGELDYRINGEILDAASAALAMGKEK